MIKFNAPKNSSSIIKVMGIGGGGSNAVNHMYNQGIQGVDFIVCNTDSQALDMSPVPTKIQLGPSLTEGRGAGSLPHVGKNAAIENLEDIKALLETNTKMIFITAGMGGGTGTGGAPVIAEAARQMGILTVGIVTLPFSFEGRKRRLQADEGINELRKNVDTLLIISNDKLREEYGNLKLTEAFSKADDILTTAAKGIAEIITVAGNINVDFNDVETVMKDSGVAIMGRGVAEGENRAINAVEEALISPLLNDNKIKGASNILLYIAYGEEEISMDEVAEITDYIQQEAGSTAEVIWGHGNDSSLGNKISVTIIATGFKPSEDLGFNTGNGEAIKKKYVSLDDDVSNLSVRQTIFANPINAEIHPITYTLDEAQPSIDSTPKFRVDSIIHQTQESQEYSWIKKDERKPVEDFVLRIEDTFTPETSVETNNEKDFKRKANERIAKLKGLGNVLKNPAELEKIEKEPAFRRRNIALSENIPSSESEVSRYTLSEDEEKKINIRINNSFLHDNVD